MTLDYTGTVEGKGVVTVPWSSDGCCVSQYWSLCAFCESLLKRVESTQIHKNLSADMFLYFVAWYSSS